MKTTNYSIFSYFPDNRKITGSKIKRLINSINKIGYIEGMAILVDEQFRVIDGQHRLEACKMLNIPVPYVIDDSKIDYHDKMILLNSNQDVWRLQDYVKTWAMRGIECYNELIEFENKYHFGTSNNIIIVSGIRLNASKIRKGEVFEVNKQRDEIANFMLQSKKYLPFYKVKNYVLAVVILHKKADKQAIDKLLKHIISIREQPQVSYYLTSFENIINKYKKTNDKYISLI